MATESRLFPPLAAPERLPLLPPEHVAAFGPCLVVAPHPDDETLGCGGLLALLSERGLPAHVLVVSDGSMSHPNARRYPPARLAREREAEARAAIAALELPPTAIDFLGLPDTRVPSPGAPDFADAARRCRLVIQRLQPASLFVPWRRDPHGDHRATWAIVRAAVASLARPPRLIEYPIWVWDLGAPADAPAATEVMAWRLDIGPVLARKQIAIAAHRSQTTDLIDDPDGFRLPESVLARCRQPWEVFLEGRP